jgi:exonuclease, DNA polymerase III, epsilon subunit family
MLSKSLSDITFAFLDIETTGLDAYLGDRVCEIAILRTRDGRILDSFETLVNPGRNIPPGAVSINGITDDMVKGSPFFVDVAYNILSSVNGSVIVAHNAPFDLGFLFREFANIKLMPFENEVIDTLSIARRYYSFPSNGLGKIAKYLGISTVGEHRALGDVRITKEIFEYFLMDLARRGIRIKSLKDILKLQERPVSFRTSNELVLPPSIQEALRARGKVQIKYLSAYRDTTTIRVIEPLELKVSGSYAYVVAFCHMRKENCRFRLDRILEVKNIS